MKCKSNFETVQSGDAKNLFGYKIEGFFSGGDRLTCVSGL